MLYTTQDDPRSLLPALAAGTPDDETIVIVAGADDRFAIGLTVALSSALRHLDQSRRTQLYILDGGLSQPSRERCRSALARARPDAEVNFVDSDPSRFSGYREHGYTRAAYLRLLIPEVVPEHHRRVLYLDSDVVVGDDIAKLWALPDEGKVFWAAFDEGVRRKHYVPTFDFTNFPEGTPYFNSGVMLIDLPRWKAARVSEQAQAILADHSDQCRAVDQDALNVAGRGIWSVLPAAWNLQVTGMKLWSPMPAEAGAPIGVIHYLGPKPWMRETQSLRQGVFDDALQASGWFTPLDFLRYRMVKRITDWARIRCRVGEAIACPLGGAPNSLNHGHATLCPSYDEHRSGGDQRILSQSH